MKLQLKRLAITIAMVIGSSATGYKIVESAK
jgi:hypothetical protein